MPIFRDFQTVFLAKECGFFSQFQNDLPLSANIGGLRKHDGDGNENATKQWA